MKAFDPKTGPGITDYLLGNEAIARGIIEAGVDVVAAYPGTPSSEIGDTLHKHRGKFGVHFEYSVNEKIALETAAAVSIGGGRAVSIMKHVGVNVAMDALGTLATSGVRGGYILISADDPQCHSSQSEQDNRIAARLMGLPVMEPSSTQETKEFMIEGMRLSEEIEMPFMLRTTTHINHTRGPVELGEIRPQGGKKEFVRDRFRFVNMPSVARSNRLRQLKQMEEARKLSNITPLNRVEGSGPTLIIAAGHAYNVTRDVVDKLGIDARILKLGFSHPIPDEVILREARTADRVIIIEELEPVIEREVRSILHANELPVKVIGKDPGPLPRPGEYGHRIVQDALASILDLKVDTYDAPDPPELPPRPPVLCPGCSHAIVTNVAKRVFGEDSIVSLDIGCYTLMAQPPISMGDALLCMGASIGMANGFDLISDQPVVAFIGDSTFFHSGIHPLINAVFNNHNFTLVILDNHTTGMTGHQPTPEYGPPGTQRIDIEPLVRACGVKSVVTMDPIDHKAFEEALRNAKEEVGVSVVIPKRPCNFWKPLTQDADEGIAGGTDVCAAVTGGTCPGETVQDATTPKDGGDAQ